MPNPIIVELGINAQYTFETHATATQNLSFRPRSPFKKPQNRSGSGDKFHGTFDIDDGIWEIHHEASPTGAAPWFPGDGRVRDDIVVEFDDNPESGDGDYDDAQLVFIRGLIRILPNEDDPGADAQRQQS